MLAVRYVQLMADNKWRKVMKERWEKEWHSQLTVTVQPLS